MSPPAPSVKAAEALLYAVPHQILELPGGLDLFKGPDGHSGGRRHAFPSHDVSWLQQQAVLMQSLLILTLVSAACRVLCHLSSCSRGAGAW